MKKIFRKILLFLLLALLIIQFIRPEKNLSSLSSNSEISKIYIIPDSVMQILKVACYDCHSNNTRYPWYAKIQPVYWWLSDHIDEGKKGLNFSEFATYSIRKQYDRMEGISELVKKEEMPLSSYRWIHQDARLNDKQKQAIISWASNIHDTLKSRYPTDSLIKKPRDL